MCLVGMEWKVRSRRRGSGKERQNGLVFVKIGRKGRQRGVEGTEVSERKKIIWNWNLQSAFE